MSAKHTPGPWHDNDTHDGEGPMAVWTSRSSGKFICCAQYPFPNSPRRDREEVSDDERVANIRLIAAAPELLEALIAISTHPHINLGDLVYSVREAEGEGWEGPQVAAWSSACESVKAAIAKATGKEGA